jgi:hypothetical protein
VILDAYGPVASLALAKLRTNQEWIHPAQNLSSGKCLSQLIDDAGNSEEGPFTERVKIFWTCKQKLTDVDPSVFLFSFQIISFCYLFFSLLQASEYLLNRKCYFLFISYTFGYPKKRVLD